MANGTNTINLVTLLKLSEGGTTGRQISVDYLSTLSDLLGPERALSVAKQQHSVDDIARMEKIYDTFEFSYQPKTPKAKLRRVLEFLEWEKIFPDVTSMGYFMQTITESYTGLKTLVNKIIATGDRDVMKFNPFVQDQLYGVAGELLEKYGVVPTAENKKTGHFARAFFFDPKKVVPGITTGELIDLCIDKKRAGTPADQDRIVEGFDDARTALEVSAMTINILDGLLYVKNGFTSLEQVKTVNLNKLRKLEDAFDFAGKWGSRQYHQKQFTRYVSRYISGKPERVDEMLSLAKRGGQKYLVAFDGSVNQTQRILKMEEDKRPSAAAITEVRMTGVYEFNRVVELARGIDHNFNKYMESIVTKSEG